MPIFPQQNLLFVHIPKNAGRSIEAAFLGSEDGPHVGRRSLINRMAHVAMVLTASRFPRTHLIGTLDHVLAAQHMTYGEMDLLGYLPDTELKSFAVCRNPFDRAVSSVFHFSAANGPGRKPDTKTEFEYALNQWLDRDLRDHNERAHRRPQYDFIIDRHGRVAVDAILRFESLQSDLSAFLATVGLEGTAIPRTGASPRKRSYSDYFTRAARNRVEAEYEADLEHFGYEYGCT